MTPGFWKRLLSKSLSLANQSGEVAEQGAAHRKEQKPSKKPVRRTGCC